MFKSTQVQFEGRLQHVEDLIDRARFHAQTNRSYSLEIIVHLQDHAIENNDDELKAVCRSLMMSVQSPSPYATKHNQQTAGDINNRPRSVEPPVKDVVYDNRLDIIFDERVKVSAVKMELDKLVFKKSGRTKWFVVYRVFLYLKWLKEGCQQKKFLQWVNLQFHCGWTKEIHFVFSKDVNKTLRDKDVSYWNTIDNKAYTKGKEQYEFAVLLRNTFETIIVNGKEVKGPVTDFSIGRNRDKTAFMANPSQLINWGK